MNSEVSPSLFSTDVTSAPRSWRSYVTSGLIHALVVVLLLMIHAVVTTEETKPPANQVATKKILLAPYRPKPIRAPRLQAPPQVAKVQPPPKPKPVVVPPVVPPPPAPKPVVAHQEPPKEAAPAKTTEVAAAKPLPPAPVERPRLEEPAPAAKPQIRTGVFGAGDSPNKSQAAKQLKMGGFGDPSGVQPAKEDKGPTLLAKVGSFDLPPGAGQGGGGQKSNAVRQGVFGGGDNGSGGSSQGKETGRTVTTGGFGNGGGAPQGGQGTGNHGTVATGGFNNTIATPAQTAQRTQPTGPVTTPVEILYKPTPVYTQEARALKVEGEASLEVIFCASGAIRVVRILHGLGHGLDQAAEQAAAQIRFKPGTRDGAPVDTKATIRIVFQLS